MHVSPEDHALDGLTTVPRHAYVYLCHTEAGVPIRQIARLMRCHASTVLRQVRKVESQRDDPLVDRALRRLGACHFRCGDVAEKLETTLMKDFNVKVSDAPRDGDDVAEAIDVLGHLAEPGAVLAVADGMDKAVVVRDGADGQPERRTVVDRALVEALALRAWIACDDPGRISRYRITAPGRAVLRDAADAGQGGNPGFQDGQRLFTHRSCEETPARASGNLRRQRYAMAESPVVALARRRDRDGKPFLTDELVAAGARLREDFELSRVGQAPGEATDWEAALGGNRDAWPDASDAQVGADAARGRVAAALRALGPGLGDVALRCCCYLEGLETAEKRMGWSARSGKIVLRIALQQLRRHYAAQGTVPVLIG